MDSLLEAAMSARSRAHAPHSDYSVGAAIETEDGSIIVGCNVESASYGLTICAERVAVTAAIAQGHRSFKRLAVAPILRSLLTKSRASSILRWATISKIH